MLRQVGAGWKGKECCGPFASEKASWKSLLGGPGTELSVRSGRIGTEGRQADCSVRWHRGGVLTPPPPPWKLRGKGLCWSIHHPDQVALKC